MAMTDPNKNTDRLIDDALAMVRSALGDDQFDFNHALPRLHLKSVETNLVISQVSDKPEPDLSITSFEMVESVLQIRSPPPVQITASDAFPPEPVKSYQNYSLAIEATTEAETAPVREIDLGPAIEQAFHTPSHQESWLDRERATLHERAAAFRETQLRFQREREEYYTATMAAARANQWNPIH